MEQVLRVEGLKASYGGQEVLHGVNLTVQRGEKVVIMGPSGSGKSTLLKCIVHLIKPKSGRIILDGEDLSDGGVDLKKVRAKTGFVFQQYNLFPHMNVLRNLTLPLEVVKKVPRSEAEARALQLLKAFGLEEFAYKYPLQLSGGQQQRVAIARALIMDPVLLLLDEPTSALDPELRREVLETLVDIAKQGRSMLIVTHELDFAEAAADRILLMDKGVIVEEGEPWELLYRPKSEMARRFLVEIRAVVHHKPKS
ncbi:MAG: amino acid ABC transporter ATP-binding protein [Thermofilaceae archaeon]|nr:amino acid ABC transporter ATP-binding protein [Thermofilaceae archaeon]MCX8180299.1 amino acid ABC transporter ATP-binding protein [Thermofilaceae archaeon]MDW8003834.1 amino acid ABC transporter ATP-binding protein [Thermofilaceae archaeon]